MAGRWLILADDLTGAADCAIAFARRGLSTTVGWGEDRAAADADPAVLSWDANSRGLSAAAAAARQGRLLNQLADPGRTLFKKIDSTLRGQPAAETAAVLAVLRGRFGSAFAICAPAFPATGRTTVAGRVRVDGRPLEEAEVWRRDHSYASADLAAVLATADLTAQAVPLATVRGGGKELEDALAAIAARGGGVALCDAETDADLLRIARASLPAPPGTFFIGSAGLAHALAAITPGRAPPPPSFQPSRGGMLMVVGSPAAASRAGARRLIAAGGMTHVPVEARMLLADAEGRAALGHAVAARLGQGEDVLVEIRMDAVPDLSLGPRLVDGLAAALAPAAGRMGAFAATGGETAAALLAHFGVTGIRLIEEIEPGVALGATLGAFFLPVVTKAGAFGDAETLTRIADRLRALRTKGPPP